MGAVAPSDLPDEGSGASSPHGLSGPLTATSRYRVVGSCGDGRIRIVHAYGLLFVTAQACVARHVVRVRLVVGLHDGYGDVGADSRPSALGGRSDMSLPPRNMLCAICRARPCLDHLVDDLAHILLSLRIFVWAGCLDRASSCRCIVRSRLGRLHLRDSRRTVRRAWQRVMPRIGSPMAVTDRRSDPSGAPFSTRGSSRFGCATPTATVVRGRATRFIGPVAHAWRRTRRRLGVAWQPGPTERNERSSPSEEAARSGGCHLRRRLRADAARGC